MEVFRLYTGDDGQSHIEELSPIPTQEAPQASQQIFFRELAPGTFMDWHPAPRRQYVIVLKGQLEIGLKDGTVRRVGPGEAVLASDTAGSGHTTRVVSDDPAMTAVVPLAE